MVFQQFGEPLCRGLLQHLLQHVGRTAVADEYTMILGYRSIQPKSVAHHIGIGNIAQALGSTNIYVATDYHRSESRRGLLHHSLIKRQLQVHQSLRQALAAFPAEHRNRCQDLAADSIGGQALALSASMQNNAPLALQPLSGLLKHPRGAPTRPQPMAYRVAGTKVFVTRKSCHFMETFHQIWGQRKQFLHHI